MSTAEPTETRPPADTPPATEPPRKPTRSTTEKIVVWGGIAVLLVIVGIEATSYFQHMRAHKRLLAEIEKSEQEDYRVTAPVVSEILGGRRPDISKSVKASVGEELYEVYYFDGLLKRRELCVHYGIAGAAAEDPEVVEITTIVPDEVFAN